MENPRAQGGNAWIALAISIACGCGLLAGFSRVCMPSFNLNLMLGYVGLAMILGGPLIAVLVGTPAALIAVIPFAEDRLESQFRLALAVLVALIATLALVTRAQWMWGLGLGIAIGFIVRYAPWFRRFWILYGIGLAVAIAAVVFASSHYNPNPKCSI